MLYLITGVPGSGKTLKMISDLMTRDDLKNRPLYLDEFPKLTAKSSLICRSLKAKPCRRGTNGHLLARSS